MPDFLLFAAVMVIFAGLLVPMISNMRVSQAQTKLINALDLQIAAYEHKIIAQNALIESQRLLIAQLEKSNGGH